MGKITNAIKGILKKFAAKLVYGGNIKLGKRTATWSVLYGDTMHTVKKLGGLKVKGTCGKHCKYCGHCQAGKKWAPCYVAKSYRYTSVVFRHAINTLWLREDPDAVYETLKKQISRKKIPLVFVRINQSGEFENLKQFQIWEKLAADFPNIKFWCYTKNYDVVVPELLAGNVPENLTILISIWHMQGIKAYKMVEHLSNTKAFVYCDKNHDPENGWGEEEYAKHGIIIGTYCKAYDEKGKLNHDITCEVCNKCFNRVACCKVVGCNDH